jgi:amidase
MMDLKLDATAQLDAMRAGEVSPAELMAATLDRIAEINPAHNAIVALQDRDTLIEQANNAPDGPLKGLPIAIKDLADTKGILTTHGSPIFADNVPARDCNMVAALKAAGAVIIGKTNTPEFGLGSHSYNPIYGVTRNAFDSSKSAGGSSGGAAVALAKYMTALADGSDMMGSLRNPAGWNGVYGFRPSYGLIASDNPGDRFLGQLATLGPMARSVRDLELLLSIQSAHDPMHPHSCGPYTGIPDGKKRDIAWLGNWAGLYPMEEGVLEACEASLELLKSQGHTVSRPKPPFSGEALWEAWITLRSWAIAEGSRGLFDNPRTRDMLKPEAVWEIERGLSMSATEIYNANLTRTEWFKATARMDIIALPSAQLFPFPAEWDWPKEIAGKTMDTYHRWMEVVIPASLTGLPALCVPCPDNVPMGLQLIGHRGRDADVLELGRDYETALVLN